MAKINPDLAAERQKATFAIEDVTVQFYTKEGNELRRLACKYTYLLKFCLRRNTYIVGVMFRVTRGSQSSTVYLYPII